MSRKYDFRKYFPLLKMTQEELKRHLADELTNNGRSVVNEKGYLYSPGKIPVLLVAHMDTVHKEPVHNICIDETGDILMSPQGIGGDDRCGVMMILEILKHRDCHVVFTEDEEIGCVGASYFALDSDVHKPDVNCIIEIDRRGSDDAVYYYCENKDFEDFVTSCGFKTAQGSYSDICEIAPELGVAAVNISSGYYNEHTTYEHIDMSVMRRNVSKLIKMIGRVDKKYEYVESTRYNWRKEYKSYSSSGKYSYGTYKSYNYYDDWDDYSDYSGGHYGSSQTKKDDGQTTFLTDDAKEEDHTKSGEALLFPITNGLKKIVDTKEGSVIIDAECGEDWYVDELFNVYRYIKSLGIALKMMDYFIESDEFVDYDCGGFYFEWYTEEEYNKLIYGGY